MPVKRDLTGVELNWGLRDFEGLGENRTETGGGFNAKWENFVWHGDLGEKERRLKSFGVLDDEEGFTSLEREVKELKAAAISGFRGLNFAEEF